jgi:hypothetical protein
MHKMMLSTNCGLILTVGGGITALDQTDFLSDFFGMAAIVSMLLLHWGGNYAFVSTMQHYLSALGMVSEVRKSLQSYSQQLQ